MFRSHITIVAILLSLCGCMTSRRAFDLREFESPLEAHENAEKLLDYLGHPTCNPNTRAQALESCATVFIKAGLVKGEPAFYEKLRKIILEEANSPHFKPDCATSEEKEYQRALALKMLGAIGEPQAQGDLVDWLDHSTFGGAENPTADLYPRVSALNALVPHLEEIRKDVTLRTRLLGSVNKLKANFPQDTSASKDHFFQLDRLCRFYESELFNLQNCNLLLRDLAAHPTSSAVEINNALLWTYRLFLDKVKLAASDETSDREMNEASELVANVALRGQPENRMKACAILSELAPYYIFTQFLESFRRQPPRSHQDILVFSNLFVAMEDLYAEYQKEPPSGPVFRSNSRSAARNEIRLLKEKPYSEARKEALEVFWNWLQDKNADERESLVCLLYNKTPGDLCGFLARKPASSTSSSERVEMMNARLLGHLTALGISRSDNQLRDSAIQGLCRLLHTRFAKVRRESAQFMREYDNHALLQCCEDQAASLAEDEEAEAEALVEIYLGAREKSESGAGQESREVKTAKDDFLTSAAAEFMRQALARPESKIRRNVIGHLTLRSSEAAMKFLMDRLTAEMSGSREPSLEYAFLLAGVLLNHEDNITNETSVAALGLLMEFVPQIKQEEPCLRLVRMIAELKTPKALELIKGRSAVLASKGSSLKIFLSDSLAIEK